jgi:MFS transporter, DHA2 family, multidrug resistance protein
LIASDTSTVPRENLTTFVRGQEAGKWIVAASVLLGSFLSVMDATVVNVAMPHMMGTFGTDLLTITWVSTAYSIAEIIQITMSAWWARLLGRKQLYLLSMGIFITGSVLAGASRTLGEMIFFRIVQGIGGGSLMPISQAIVREKFPPEEQAMSMALYSMGVFLAPAVGPVVGGLLIDDFGWPWVFYINVPFCIAGFIMVSTFVHDPPYLKRGLERVDWMGVSLVAVGLAALQIVLERGEEVDWFASHWIVAGSIIAGAALLTLVIWEIRSPDPVINFSLFRNRGLAVGSAYGSVLSFAVFGSSFILPNLVEGLFGYPAFQAGMVMIPRTLAMLVMMPLVGRVYNYVSPRLLVLTSIVLLFIAYWNLGHLAVSAGFWNFVPWLIISGTGMSCSMVVMSTISLSTMPPRFMTQASSIYALSRRVSGNIAYALLATLVARRIQSHRAALVPNISRLNDAFVEASGGLRERFLHPAPLMAPGARTLSMINNMINTQAMMMAYNDVYLAMCFLFLLVVPLIVLLPKRGIPKIQEIRA